MNSEQPRIPSTELESNANVHSSLAEAFDRPEEQIDLGRAALAIAMAHVPELDQADYLRRLDELAADVRRAIGRRQRPVLIVEAFNRTLIDGYGLHGNIDDYYNPANSLLNYVLDHRRGLPITLSILYLAVAHRLGIPMFGVGMPLHFIVKYVAAGREILIDPFYGGVILTPRQCHERIEQLMGRAIDFDPAYLNVTPKRLILYRLLNNLKQLYLSRDDTGPAGLIIEQMLIVKPELHDQIRDRGMLLLEVRAYTRAAKWLTHYLDSEPRAADSDAVRRTIARAYDCRARLN